MSWIDGIRTRLDQLIRPASSDARTDEEIRFHVEMETERNVAAGTSQQEARRQAVLAFGSVQGHREQMRDGRTAWAGALADDSRYAVRHFGRRPLITITMIALLALGMSITTVSFSFMYSYAAAPPAGVASADDLVRVRGIGTQLGEGQVAGSFLSGGMRLSVLGMLIGLPLSMLGLRYFMSVPEFGMPPVALGPVAAIAAGGILLVAAAASWIPARRAAGIDPSITLRRE